MAKDSIQKVKIVGDALNSPSKEKPHIRLDETDFPGAKDLKVDDEITVTVKAKVTQVGRERWSSDKKIWVDLDIENVKTVGETDPLRKGMDSVPLKNVRK